MDGSPSIREAALEDADAIAELLNELGYPSTGPQVHKRLAVITADRNYNTWVAEQGSEIVGLAGACIGYYYERDGIYGRLLVLVVRSTARRRGVGSALVRTVEEWVRERGGSHVVINSGAHRQDAHRFYERMGYAITGLRFVKALETSE